MQVMSTLDIVCKSDFVKYVQKLCIDATESANAKDISVLSERLTRCFMKYPAVSTISPRQSLVQLYDLSGYKQQVTREAKYLGIPTLCIQEDCLDFFTSQHPRDKGVFPSYYKVVKSDGLKLTQRLEKTSILVSHFSKVIHEAMMMGRGLSTIIPTTSITNFSKRTIPVESEVQMTAPNCSQLLMVPSIISIRMATGGTHFYRNIAALSTMMLSENAGTTCRPS